MTKERERERERVEGREKASGGLTVSTSRYWDWDRVL